MGLDRGGWADTFHPFWVSGQSAQQTGPIKPSPGCKLSQTINVDGAGRDDRRSSWVGGRLWQGCGASEGSCGKTGVVRRGEEGASVFLELHVVGRAHLHRPLADIFPVGAQDGAAWLHLQREHTGGNRFSGMIPPLIRAPVKQPSIAHSLCFGGFHTSAGWEPQRSFHCYFKTTQPDTRSKPSRRHQSGCVKWQQILWRVVLHHLSSYCKHRTLIHPNYQADFGPSWNLHSSSHSSKQTDRSLLTGPSVTII